MQVDTRCCNGFMDKAPPSYIVTAFPLPIQRLAKITQANILITLSPCPNIRMICFSVKSLLPLCHHKPYLVVLIACLSALDRYADSTAMKNSCQCLRMQAAPSLSISISSVPSSSNFRKVRFQYLALPPLEYCMGASG